jgi:MscS family membrane protein
VVPLVERSLRVCLLILAVLVICKSVFHQDIGTWLAGLGIAGLAVSLAAQDTLKNLFGSLTLLFDRPFQIGDHVVLCGTDGTIEDIGFRSTKIRTSPGHLVAIPNSNVVNASIENISRRCAIRRVINLTIADDTPIEKLRDALKALANIFEEDEIRKHVHPSSNHGIEKAPQVRFEDIVAEGFKLTITYWYAPASDPNYSAHTEQVNLRIVEILQRRGIVAPRLPLPEDPVT